MSRVIAHTCKNYGIWMERGRVKGWIIEGRKVYYRDKGIYGRSYMINEFWAVMGQLESHNNGRIKGRKIDYRDKRKYGRSYMMNGYWAVMGQFESHNRETLQLLRLIDGWFWKVCGNVFDITEWILWKANEQNKKEYDTRNKVGYPNITESLI